MSPLQVTTRLMPLGTVTQKVRYAAVAIIKPAISIQNKIRWHETGAGLTDEERIAIGRAAILAEIKRHAPPDLSKPWGEGL
jgi:hypothetical protein